MNDSCYNCALRHLCYLYTAMIDEAFNEDTVPHKLWCKSYTKERYEEDKKQILDDHCERISI